MAHATHLYFDHPQEPDPDEKGLTWATRYIDDRKVFDYRPNDLFGNAKSDSNGMMLSGKCRNLLTKFHYTRCNTPKRVTSWRGPSSPHCARATQLLSKKYRSGGEPLATLCPI